MIIYLAGGFSIYFHGKGKQFYPEFKLRLDHIKNEKQ